MALTVYQYAKCSTCRKALKWLDEHGLSYQTVGIVEQPPSQSALQQAIRSSGLPLRSFFNTSGESYRHGGFKDRLPSMSEAQAVAALAADGKLIKRPLLIAEDQVLVGFDEEAWSKRLLPSEPNR
jgi:arsenate reductase (glutaredoxin)